MNFNDSNFLDFNDAEDQQSFEIIPKGTIVKVSLNIKPGGYTDVSRGWTGGWATRKEQSGAVYLDCEYVVLEGEYAKRKIFDRIGLHSEKGPTWENMGKTLIKAILNSAHGLSAKDVSPQAQAARRIRGYQDLNGLQFTVIVGVETNEQNGSERNTIKKVLTLDYFGRSSYVQNSTANATPSWSH
jgi:hypothetical protein